MAATCGLVTLVGACEAPKHTPPSGMTTFCRRHDSAYNLWLTDERKRVDSVVGITAAFRRFAKRFMV